LGLRNIVLNKKSLLYLLSRTLNLDISINIVTIKNYIFIKLKNINNKITQQNLAGEK